MSFLERVLAEKEKEIARRKLEMSLETLELMAGREPTRDFARAINGRGRIIAEIKQRTPDTPRFSSSSILEELPVIYEQNGASALSVVTDTLNFGITPDAAGHFRRRTSLPMLVKDFFIEPYQILAARAFHADAVLLIARVLPPASLACLLAYVRGLGMRALVEVHTTADIEKACTAGAKIIGINNRDLDSLDVVPETTMKLLPRIPAGMLVVSESGINSRGMIESLTEAGVNAFLVGRSLLDSPDPGKRLRELSGGGRRDSSSGTNIPECGT